MKNPPTLCQIDTVYSADSVETCPANPALLAVGTYQLRKKPGDDGTVENALPADRLGRLYLHSIASDNALPLVQQVDVPAILDMKWNLSGNQLAVANSIGQIQLWNMSTDFSQSLSPAPRLALQSTVQVVPLDSNVLCLSLDWSGRLCSSPAAELHHHQLAVSLSNGHLALVDPTIAAVTHSWPAHTLEAWCTAFDPHSANGGATTLYSGADDAHFSVWDTRSLTRTMANSKVHQAGVTSIAPSLAKENLVVTGSYDEHVRVWDKRHLREPVKEVAIGGGAWRIRFDPNRPASRVVVAGMHAGFFVVDLDTEEEDKEITHLYAAHESLAYGVDWCGDGLGKVASCSFYDHALHLWQV